MKRSWIALLSLLFVVVVVAAPAQQAAKTFPAPSATAARMVFSGTWSGTYSSSVVKPTKVKLIFQQFGATVTGTYLSANGAQGVMYGSVTAAGLTATAQQTTPTCPGSFAMKAQVSGTTLTWTFDGKDCLGVEDGKGTATKQ